MGSSSLAAAKPTALLVFLVSHRRRFRQRRPSRLLEILHRLLGRWSIHVQKVPMGFQCFRLVGTRRGGRRLVYTR
jgi:hypothetical protein